MDSVIRGFTVYLFLLVIFRVAGKQTLSQMTSFDLVLLLIISETTQEAMVNGDHSVTNGFLLIITLVGTSILLSALKHWSPRLEVILEGQPMVVVEKGKLQKERMDKTLVDVDEILASARKGHGLERLDQIKYAVLERDGSISIVPREEPK